MSLPLTRPWLFLPPKLAHDISPKVLPVFAKIRPLKDPHYRPLKWRHLYFSNRIGLAGGSDKNAENVEDWLKLGAGFVEVGTVTPLPQSPNPGKIVDRSPSQEAVWNKMGFPNKGVDYLQGKLSQLSKDRLAPVFVNIGKNRNTPNERAHEDYIKCMQTVGDLADVFVVNISSPNTKGLRDLFKKEIFGPFLNQIIEAKPNKNTPILLKLSPDIGEENLYQVLDLSLGAGVDGWILTNTTTDRSFPGVPFPKEGGLSGRPLAAKSKEMLERTINYLGSARTDQLLVSVGGISDAKDVQERFEMGADLVQLYSALIFQGPFLFQHILKDLRQHQ